MSRSLPLVFALALVATPAFAKPTTWTIDPSHSSSEFHVKHMMVSDVRGEFGKITGTVVYDAENPGASSVDATLDAATVNTNDEKRDGHLKSPEFFDVAKCPTLTFKSKKVVKAGELLKMTGDLTLHCVTKEVTFDVQPPAKPVKSPFGDVRSGATAVAKINRYDFGLKWNKAIEGSGVLVGEEVFIGINVELVQKTK